MPFGKIVPRPGIESRPSQLAAKGGWWACQLIRWLGGFVQKLGGWQRITSTALIGVCRALHVWSDLNGVPYLAAGTSQRLEVFIGGMLYDITPLRATDNVAVSFSTTSASPIVQITDATNNADVGDWVNVVTAVSVGGLIIQGLYIVVAVIDGNNYTIRAASNATGTITNGGAVALFTTTMTSATVQVTLDNHGLSVGSLYTVHVPTTVATILISGNYNVVTFIDSNNFTITASTTASTSTSGSENGGDVRLQYLIPSGLTSNEMVAGYGVGIYGSGLYGVGTGLAFVPLRLWFLDNWGKDLIGNYSGSPIYYWTTPDTNSPAFAIATAPTINNGSFVMAPEQIVVAWGSETGAVQDPNLIRWSDVADNTDWIASSTNQAGSFRLSTGSRIVGGLFHSQQAIFWTDIDCWSMTYQNVPFVFGFNQIGAECGLIAPNAAGVIGGQIMWMSYKSFFTIGASGAQPIQCPVWDQVFGNLTTTQLFKIITAVNDYFNEIAWYYPSASGSGEIDSYVKFNVTEGTWDYGTLTRTAWTGESALGAPIGVDGASLLQQHEVSNDNDGMPLIWFAETGYTDVAEGEGMIFVDQIIPDVAASTTAGAQLQITLRTTNWSEDQSLIYGPFSATLPTNYISCRARGRQVAVRVGSSDLGSFIRVGAIRYRYSMDGGR